jgi:hypothetical protein
MREKREKKKKFHRNPTIVPPHTRIVPLGRGPRRAFNVAMEGDVWPPDDVAHTAWKERETSTRWGVRGTSQPPFIFINIYIFKKIKFPLINIKV